MIFKLIRRSFAEFLSKRKVRAKFFYFHHEPTKVMTRQFGSTKFFNNILCGVQPSVLMSHRSSAFSLDDPFFKNHVLNILQENANQKNPHSWHKLKDLMIQREHLEKDINALNDLKKGGEDDKELRALAEEEQATYYNELIDLDREILRTLLPRSAHETYSEIMVEISSGAGGQEAMLFANELLQLYENYALLKGWTFYVESVEKSDLGGIKNATIFIQGAGSYYCMQNEIGVHRVQRVPVTSTAGLIHTSTAAVIVMPQPTEVDIKLADKDLVIETTRASGPGGQNVNKSESAVRIKHLPSGLVVECQEHKHQHSNKKQALIKLRTKLFDAEMQKQSKEISSTRQIQLRNRERSAKIRTYNFPQNRVTDHRLHITTHNIREFMEGGTNFNQFLEKLNEENENELILQFIEAIKQNR